MNSQNTISQLLELSHQLGQEARGFALLGEGNTSARLENDADGNAIFAVKASGATLETLDENGLALCRLDDILALFQSPTASDEEIDDALLSARTSQSRKPSTEALFHAYLLSLPDVNFVGHTHPRAVNALLCSPRARDFTEKRLFPDQIVCCGAASVTVPYVHPGVPLALAIREQVETFRFRFGYAPRTIFLKNHGLIALGKTPQAVFAATLMAEKAARIFINAAALGGPVFLSAENVARIAAWPAEHLRQQMLNL